MIGQGSISVGDGSVIHLAGVLLLLLLYRGSFQSYDDDVLEGIQGKSKENPRVLVGWNMLQICLMIPRHIIYDE